MVIERDLLILGDMKMSLNIFKLKESKEKGDITLIKKFECYETDALTCLHSFKTIKELGQT